LPNGLVETALRAPAFAKATAGKMEDRQITKKFQMGAGCAGLEIFSGKDFLAFEHRRL
jgi:hypothetical protein